MSIFKDLTPEEIRNRILDRWSTSLQTREGSFCYDAASPLAFEAWRVFMTLDELIDAFYVTANSGKYLDDHADLLGLARRQGTRAIAVVQFTGENGVIIPAGTMFYTAAGLEFSLIYAVELAEGVGTGYIKAKDVGSIYNIAAGEISQILNNISGLTSYTNEDADGGTDPESDAALFDRICYRRKHPSTSGNENHYKEWALSCDGVGAAKPQKLWNGPGTVRVLLAGYDRKPVSEAIVDSCAEYIETQRPVGAEVTIQSVTAVDVAVSASITTDGTVSVESVSAEYVSKLGTYLQETVDAYFASTEVTPYMVYYNRIASLLMSIPGVVDFAVLTVNGGTDNISIDGVSVPVLGEVSVQ